VKRWIWGITALALLGLLIWRVDRQALAAALRGAEFRYLLIAGVLNLILGVGACAGRLGSLLRPLEAKTPPSRRELFELYLASSAAHNLLPSPAGEVVRTIQLRNRHGYSASSLIGAQLVEKWIEAAGLGLLLLIAAFSGHAPTRILYALFAVLAVGAVILLVVGRRWPALRSSSAPGTLLAALGWTLLSDLTNAATVGLTLASLGLGAPISAWLVVVLANRLAGVVPATPGQLGVFEGGIVIALAGFGVPASAALAFALLYHAVHLVPVTSVGLFFMRRLR
jgi:uncharacterized membrane protein YbhN (UPF0104 family)